jgi:hypothetical protein
MLVNQVSNVSIISFNKIWNKLRNSLLDAKLCETKVVIILFTLLIYEFSLYDFNISEYMTAFDF